VLEDMKRSGVTHVEVSNKTIEELGKPIVAVAAPAATTADSSVELAAVEARRRCV